SKEIDDMEIERIWNAAADVTDSIRAARLVKQHEKRHRKIIQTQGSLLKADPNLDLDVAFYFLKGVIARYKSAKEWETIYSLISSTIPYQTADGLRILNSQCLA